MSIKDMLGRTGVASRDEALKLLQERFVVPVLAAEEISFNVGPGQDPCPGHHRTRRPSRVRPLHHGRLCRPFRRYLRSRRVASGPAPGRRRHPMGSMPDRGIGKAETMKIATGGALPGGADAVVMFEHTQAVDAGEHRGREACRPARERDPQRRRRHAGRGCPAPRTSPPAAGPCRACCAGHHADNGLRAAEGRPHLHGQRDRPGRQPSRTGPDPGQQFLQSRRPRLPLRRHPDPVRALFPTSMNGCEPS